MPHAIGLVSGNLFLITRSVESLSPCYDEAIGHLLKIVEVDESDVYWDIEEEDGTRVWESDGYTTNSDTPYDDAIDREYFDVVIRELGLEEYNRNPTWEV
jgi:hypothetical protein